MRTNARALVALALLGLGVVASAATTNRSAAAADDVEVVDLAGIDVVQITGLIDPENESLLRDSLDDAERRDSTLVVIQLDSGGAVGVDLIELRDRIQRSAVPIAVWIGPAGATARGGAAYLATAAPILSMASNAKIGPCAPFALDESGERTAQRCEPDVRLSADAAVEAKVADQIDPSLRNLLFALDGRRVVMPVEGEITLSTKMVVPGADDPSINQDLRFRKLDITGQVLHTIAAPWVAYFLFVAGLSLLVFEFYAASVGAGALVGVLALVGACTGFSHLPVNGLGVALIIVGLLGLTIDVQAGGAGPWTAIGLLALVTGSLTLYDGSSRLDPPWWTIALVTVGVIAFFVGGLPAMLRTRFSTPTVGREGMIGEMGTAEVDLKPEGVVRVRGALWKARVNRSTPIKPGEAVRVVAVQGLVLEVEPETGGAQDYRERARKRGGRTGGAGEP